MSAFFNTVFYQPLYNGFIFLFDVFPWADAGILVILFTIIIKLVLFPLSYKSAKTQLQMKNIEPELKKIRDSVKDKQEQALKIMELYKSKGVNPFSGLVLIIIQLPIIFALYYIFLKSGLPEINNALLYPFIGVPEGVSMEFLGLINIASKSALLALLAAVSSFFQLKFSIPPMQPKDGPSTFKDDLARTMNLQMKYVFPIVVFFISYNISGVVALYWFTSNMFTIAQELYVRRKLAAPKQAAISA